MNPAKLEIHPLQSALSDMFAQISESRQVTLADRYGLLALMLCNNLSEEERIAIDRLLRAVKRGRVKISNEISTISSL